jgi:hypothetical protein
VIPTDDAPADRERQIIDRLMPVVKARMTKMELDEDRRTEGLRGISIQAPRIVDPRRRCRLPGSCSYENDPHSRRDRGACGVVDDLLEGD